MKISISLIRPVPTSPSYFTDRSWGLDEIQKEALNPC